MFFASNNCFISVLSMCCKNISAMVLEIGDPIEIPVFGWYIWFLNLGVDGWIILGWISRRWDVGIWTGLGWPRIETGGGRL